MSPHPTGVVPVPLYLRYDNYQLSYDIIADGVSLLNVVRMLGPGEPVRTEC